MFPFNPGTANLAPLMDTGLQLQARFNPFDLQAQRIQSQDVQAQTAERQANTQNLALEAQKRQRDLTNAKSIRDNWQTTLQQNGGKVDDDFWTKMQAIPGVDPTAIEEVKKAHVGNDEAVARTLDLKASADQATQAANKARSDLSTHIQLVGARAADRIAQANYSPTVAEAAISDLEQDPNFKASGGGDKLRQLMVSNPQAFQQKIDQMRQNPDLLAEQQGLAEKKATTRETTARATQAEEQTKALQLSNEAAQQFVQHPEAVLGSGGMIDRLNLDAQTSSRLKNQIFGLYQLPGTPQEKQTAVKAAIQKAVDDANQTAQVVARETNPQVRAARVADAISTEVGKQVALAKASPDAFGGIIDTKSRTAAQTQYEKDSKEYADKLGATQQANDMIAQAQGGNKAAPGLIPIGELRQFVNRVNTQELKSVSSSAGSAYDRVQGFVSKYTEGQPIPAAVLNDMRTVNNAVAQAARRTYEYKVNVTNKTYGAKATPIDLSGAGAGQPAAAAAPAIPSAVRAVLKTAGAGIHTLSDGTKWLKAADGTITQQ